ncbi:MAG: non-canonical purine NTP pyrophosphatase [Candidatus Saccharibacteria bacterium]|nr:non-canonical purine NTP pyrophosphatase [Candidatus Saccharibacteria bacterium]
MKTFSNEIVLATHNSGKLLALQKIFSEYKLLSLDDIGFNLDIDENQPSFLGNAEKKATAVFQAINRPVLADDSGLTIDALGGFPGVMTHRFLGENASDEERNLELIHRLDQLPIHTDRTARFVCCLVYRNEEGITASSGEIVGRIARAPRGQNGFGFDPIFELADGRTLAELSPEEKIKLDARRLAAERLEAQIRLSDLRYRGHFKNE